jgi:hypothetical protein
LQEMSSMAFLFRELLNICLFRTFFSSFLLWLWLVLLSTILFKGDNFKKNLQLLTL